MTRPVYLDHNATTPIDPLVIEAMEPYLREVFGNPSSVEHQHGHDAGRAVEDARISVAKAIGARENEIVFTASATEANNIAIFGAARASSGKRHLVTSVIEHPAVLEPIRALEREGFTITYLGVDESGRISLDELERSITPETALVSIMAANNEVGVIQPYRRIGEICTRKDTLFHSDLAQLIAYHPVDVEADNIHLASLSGHKAYGPKGIGALYVRSRRPRVKLVPMMFGGGQEKGLRPGTLNTASIVGMGRAFSICTNRAASDAKHVAQLCAQFWEILTAVVPDARLNGPTDSRLANNLSISVDGIEPLALMRRLRTQISFSSSSACATDKMQTSHVLLAMFGNTARARQAFRIAPGRFSTAEEVREMAGILADDIVKLRESTQVA
ncbi:cysteine desulfurase DndA [Agrobacterium deltaense]|uniref:cysteine desulfurase family protein n=1 Tax=Agrobacterium TaxID=357 RepID=UPI0007459ED4|nr:MULTISPECIES: aminotransferase class V-fold PLP-dependent enzyme [Agrobacterium]KVK54335.1 aminotransferase class V [Agrobacterium sp. D14]RKF41743.1 cysteine desulfurase DndA [Agrobacterium deltaense]